MDTSLSELYGAMLGDGCLSSFVSGGRSRRVAVLTGHLLNDHAYYQTVLRPILRAYFSSDGYLYKRHSRCALVLVMGQTVFDFLYGLGFPVGKKRNLLIPQQIRTSLPHSIACVRGIFDTDGSVYRRYSRQYKGHTRIYDSLVVQFKLEGYRLLQQVKEILFLAGIGSNTIIREKNTSVLRITRQEDIARFMAIVRPSNPYHVERYLNRCKRVTTHGPLAQR
ncbi:hypothetical protein C4580_03065 [Candidatus Woesearchaeota archaeon]|nr:MAG: hypothetical protein C4580_03065 [Candidatus Woesearchaeota archaeon]